jgi:hypothetical protein
MEMDEELIALALLVTGSHVVLMITCPVTGKEFSARLTGRREGRSRASGLRDLDAPSLLQTTSSLAP